MKTFHIFFKSENFLVSPPQHSLDYSRYVNKQYKKLKKILFSKCQKETNQTATYFYVFLCFLFSFFYIYCIVLYSTVTMLPAITCLEFLSEVRTRECALNR
jgi:hypothetical protein